MRRILVTAALLATLTACSSSGKGPDVATVDGTATPSPTSTLSFEEQGLRHARCMREHGVPEADPRPNGNGGTRVGGGYDKTTLDQQVLADAIAACRQYEPVLPPDEAAGKAAAAREESRCMRAHGVEDFPDPGANGRPEVPESVRLDPQYEEAERACIRHGGSAPSASR
jgi:hypothetical protein